MNFTTGDIHPNKEVNEIIVKCRNKEIAPKEMITSIEGILGARGAWDTQDIVSEFNQRSISLDQLIIKYLALPIPKPFPSELENTEAEGEVDKIMRQHETYNNPSPEVPDKNSKFAVRNIIEKDVYRHIIFPSDSKEVYNAPNFIRRSGEKEEDIPQCVTICNIVLKGLKKSHYGLEQTINWWLGHKKYIAELFAHFRTQAVHRMMKTYCELHSKEYKFRNAPDHDTPFNMLVLHTSGQDDVAGLLLDLNIDKDAYRAFLDITAASFFPKGSFKKYMKGNRLSDIITPVEEAFALLCFENAHERWEWIAKNEVEEQPSDNSNHQILLPQSKPPLRYQNTVEEKQKRKSTAGHWNNAGMARMNELVDIVLEKRNERGTFEKKLQEMYRANCSAEEVYPNWMRTENSKKRKRAAKVAVKNRLSYVEL